MEGQPDTTPLPPVPPGFETDRPPPTYRPLLLLPERIWHGHPLRLALRAIIAAVLSLVVLALIPGSAAAPADVARAGLVVRADGPVGPGPAAGPLTVKGTVGGAASFGSLPTCRARVPRRASPGGQAGPIRAGQGRPGLREASVRPPGHARPRTSQDTGQTTARRSRRAQFTTRRANTARKGKEHPWQKCRIARKNTAVIHRE